MAIIGCLGNVIFTVSRSVVRTLDNMTWSGSARYATHNRHLTNALTEFTGLDPDKITFDITLSADLGVDPIAEVVKLWNIERSGEAVPLTIGTKGYGKYRWNIIKHDMKMQAFFGNGDVHTAVVSVSLQEYLGG
ncbi:phage tail protein [uncultured Dysosmobacter sp.]|uniref:phage tail protein n=1 Tax=uncultured Dysosmobacter sp. TaxID=2591384 RepID=UPI002635C389|nr:phage tail protein [uncultured Dysosmobacter sp.]